MNETVGFTTTFSATAARTSFLKSIKTISALYGAPHFGPKFGVDVVSFYAPGVLRRVVNLFAEGGPSFARTLVSSGAGPGAATNYSVTQREGIRKWGNSSSASPSSFNDQYIMFQFDPTGSLKEYGWIEASMSVAEGNTSLGVDGPTFTIVQYSYDNTGATILAGEGAAAPEPSTLAESGLAALILGAEGLRRMRKAA